jgi:nucleoside-diphosphate-sugar epimerase
MLRVLVTGASSPLGEAVCRSLKRAGSHVTGTVRSARAGWSSPHVDEVQLLDLEEVASFQHLTGSFAAGIHVAAASTGTPEQLMRVTGMGTLHLVTRLRALEVPRVVMVSGMDVYGTIAVDTVGHLTPPRLQKPYGLAKWAAESYLLGITPGIQGVSVRSPAILGARHTRHFLARTLSQMVAGDPTIRAHSPKHPFNNAVHEDTLADFLVKLAATDCLPDVQAVVVGSTEPLPLEDILDRLARHACYGGKVEWIADGPMPFNIDLGHSLLCGFRPDPMCESLDRWLKALP